MQNLHSVFKDEKFTQHGGRGGKIRTCGLTVPNRAHYQAVLRPEIFNK